MMKKLNKKSLLVLAVLALLLTVGVGSTLAYLVTSAGPVVNEFTPTGVPIKVNEKMADNTKTDVSVTNTGNTDAYIRAAIIVTWKAADGTTYAKTPVAGTDYTLELGSGWTKKSDGYYLYGSIVAPGGTTTNLIDSITPVAGAAPEGCTLRVEIVAQSIQALPNESVRQSVWRY